MSTGRTKDPPGPPTLSEAILAGEPNANGRIYPESVLRGAMSGIGVMVDPARRPAPWYERIAGRIRRVARRCLERAGLLKPRKIGEFEKFAFPVVRRVYPNMLAPSLMSVQPMTAPAMGGERRLTPAEIIARRRVDPGDRTTRVRIPSIFEMQFRMAGGDAALLPGEVAVDPNDGSMTMHQDGDATRPVRIVALEDKGE